MFASILEEELQESLLEFIPLYENRPIRNNAGGMGFNHSWATWFLVKRIQPRILIESGVWKGHSTWLLQLAAPDSKIYSFDPDLSNREYVCQSVEYFEYDFFDHDWRHTDLSSALGFFDDHQNHLDRLLKARWLGIRNVIFEDVYPEGQGDFYTLKHMQNGSGAPRLQMSSSFRGNLFSRVRNRLLERILLNYASASSRLVRANDTHWHTLCLNIEEYFEFPPAFLDSLNLWGLPYNDRYKTKTPLLRNSPNEDFDYAYSWITFLRLS